MRSERWRFRPAPRLPTPRRYRWVLTGAGASEHDMVITGDTVRVEAAGPAAAHGTFQGATETFVLLKSGRLALPVALAQRSLLATRDAEQVDSFTQWFPSA